MRRSSALVLVSSLALALGCTSAPTGSPIGAGGKADALDAKVLEGNVVGVFIGEVDPFVVGDVCVTYVEADGTGDFPAGVYGLVEVFDDCALATAHADDETADFVSIELSPPDPVDPGAILDELLAFEPATYFELSGDPLADEIARAIDLPEGLSVTEPGQLGLLEVLVLDDHTNPDLLAQMVVVGKRSFGNDCDLVPGDAGDVELTKNASIASFVEFLRSGTADWAARMTKKQIDALEDWMLAAGQQDIHIFFGRTAGDACGGSGEVSYNLIWNDDTQQVLYLVLFPAMD